MNVLEIGDKVMCNRRNKEEKGEIISLYTRVAIVQFIDRREAIEFRYLKPVQDDLHHIPYQRCRICKETKPKTEFPKLKENFARKECTACVSVVIKEAKAQKKEDKTVTKKDNVNSPSHYQGSRGLEAIEVHRNFMTSEQMAGYHLGNTLKYLLRYQNKNGLEDLKKAKVHLDWLIEEVDECQK